MSNGIKPAGGPGGPRGSRLPNEDASSQALSEALGSSFLLVRVLVVLLVAAFFVSCIFTVNPNEVAVVLRFGRPVGDGQAMIKRQGLHFAWPYPVDEIIRVPVGEALTLQSRTAWFQVSPEDEIAGKLDGDPGAASDRLNPAADGHVLTGDGNILHVRAVMQYRITDPLAYTQNFSSVTNLLLNALNNAIYRTAAGFKADAALYKNPEGFRLAVKEQLDNWVKAAGLGVTVDALQTPVSAPLSVRPAFDAVIQAEQALRTEISKAQGEADENTRKAEGDARAIISSGMVSSNALVRAIRSDADAFQRRREDFKANPELFRQRIRSQTFSRVMTNAANKFLMDAKEIRLQLGREPVGVRKTSP